MAKDCEKMCFSSGSTHPMAMKERGKEGGRNVQAVAVGRSVGHSVGVVRRLFQNSDRARSRCGRVQGGGRDHGGGRQARGASPWRKGKENDAEPHSQVTPPSFLLSILDRLTAAFPLSLSLSLSLSCSSKRPTEAAFLTNIAAFYERANGRDGGRKGARKGARKGGSEGAHLSKLSLMATDRATEQAC